MMLRKGGTSVNKRPILALTLAGSLLLSGCSSLLLRDYSSVTVHSAAPTVESDQLTIRVESYQDLVNTLLYFITQGQEEGVIRLYNYPYDVNRDLEAACTEVVQEDPLGAYAVDYIKYDVGQTAAYYEVTVKLAYTRTPQEIAQVVSVTGTSAIAQELRDQLAFLPQQAVFRVSYFTGADSAESIRQGVLEAYGQQTLRLPPLEEVQVNLYPDSGQQRVVEILLTWGTQEENF